MSEIELLCPIPLIAHLVAGGTNLCCAQVLCLQLAISYYSTTQRQTEGLIFNNFLVSVDLLKFFFLLLFLLIYSSEDEF